MGEKTQKIQPYKVDSVKNMRELIEGAKDIIFTDYRGLNVQQIGELRRNLRAQEAQYRVIKNNYVKLALKEMDLSYDENFLIDPTALALAGHDSGPVAKVLVGFTKNSSLKVKGGIIDGVIVDAAEVVTISMLPGREQLYAMIMSTMNAPLTGMIYIMNGIVSKLARTLQAVADKKVD